MLLRPTAKLSIGANYRSRLEASVNGTGTVNNVRVSFDLTVPWPQAASLGLAYRILPALRLMASVDWTDWTSLDAITPRFSQPNLNPLGRLLLDYGDNYTLHFGAEYSLGERVAVRAGYAYDSTSIPDRTLDRHLMDAPKSSFGGGASYRPADHFWLDAAGELLLSSPRAVPESAMTLPKYLQNIAPGSYDGSAVSFQLAARYEF
jgi:long-chain fatty acid transport protein